MLILTTNRVECVYLPKYRSSTAYLVFEGPKNSSYRTVEILRGSVLRGEAGSRKRPFAQERKHTVTIQLLDHYHARGTAHARIHLFKHYYHMGFPITSRASHVVAHLLYLGEGGRYRDGRRDIGMQSMRPQVLPVLPREDVLVLRAVRGPIGVSPVIRREGPAPGDQGVPLAVGLGH